MTGRHRRSMPVPAAASLAATPSRRRRRDRRLRGVQSLDLTGPLEVFTGADRYVAPGPTASAAGRRLRDRDRRADGRADAHVERADDRRRHHPGRRRGPDRHARRRRRRTGCSRPCEDPDASSTQIARLAASRPPGRRRSAPGAFLLAEAGLLDGRRATTHWARCAEFAERYPAVTVDPDPIFTRDGNVYTSAGVTAGMDLALALVEDDLGRDAALTVARHLVLFLRRPANQAQFSAQLSTQLADRDEVRALQEWIADHVAEDCSVDRLAERAAMSPRHLARLFSEQVGTTVARYVEQVRVETARRRLEESAEPIASVAATLRLRHAPRRCDARSCASLGVGPAEYRRRFRSAVA